MSAQRTPIMLVAAAACFFLPACGTRQQTVTGTVKYKDKTLTTGNVVFYPDKSKDNTWTKTATSPIDEQGKYSLEAPAGWYKVTVTSFAPADPKDPYAPTKSYVDVRYNSIESTTIEIEIKSSAAGDYDITLP